MSVLFSRLEQTRLYIRSDTTVATARVGYLLTTPLDNPPAQLSLSDAWTQQHGAFIGFPALPQDVAALGQFIDNATWSLNEQSGVRIAWFFATSAASFVGLTTGLAGQMQHSGGTSSLTIPATYLSIGRSTDAALSLVEGTQVTINARQNGFTIAANPGNALRLWTGTAYHDLPVATTIDVQFLGDPATQGCLSLGFALDLRQQTLLNIGLRYYMPDFANPEHATYLHYPVFDSSSAALVPLGGTLDLIDPYDLRRTLFRFLPVDGAPVTLRSYFSNTLGQPISLTPQPGAGLTFARGAVQINETSATPPISVYLVPCGDFKLTLPAGAGQFTQLLMCGISAVEHLDLVVEADNFLRFVPGQPAFSPAERNADVLPPVLYRPLTPLARTAWCYIYSSSMSGAVLYHAQPDTAVLHQPVADQEYLVYLEIPANALRSLPPTSTAAFPLVPYGGVQASDLTAFYQLELQVLNPARREAIAELQRLAQASQPLFQARSLTANVQIGQRSYGATQQGLNATFVSSGDITGQEWNTFAIARTSGVSSVTNTTTSSVVQFNNIRGALRTALQSNQMFLVATSSAKFLQTADIPTTDFFGLRIQGWSFDLAPTKQQGNQTLTAWEQQNTVLIFKKHGQSLYELVQDLATWSQPDDFNDDPRATQQRLQQIIAGASALRDHPQLGPYFQNFLRIIAQESWNGIIIFNIPIVVASMPSDLQGLAAGLDPTRFYAHHLVINRNPVVAQNGQLVFSADSSLGGLITYLDPVYLGTSTTDYDFKVMSLNVLFDNSAITRFDSQVALYLNRLFGETGTLLNSPVSNNLLLSGSYQQHNANSAYVFVNEARNDFVMQSQVVSRVAITRAQFVPSIPFNGSNPNNIARSRFILSGVLDFARLPAGDLFSFGSENNTSGGLSFSNLFVNLSFPVSTPSYKTFSLDTGGMTLSLNTSRARAGSLYNHFPIRLTRFVQGTPGSTPQTLGYMPVDLPLSSEALSEQWFGLQFELNLGSFGALASQAGFIGGLILAWSPNAVEPTIFVGLSIPGVVNGRREIPIEGLLKLVFGDVRLVIDGSSYILQLNNISLNLLTLSFPPNGQTTLMLFGDPRNQDNTTLGWYAAYAKKQSTNPNR